MKRLVEQKKRAVMASHENGLEKGSDIGKDLLSILSEIRGTAYICEIVKQIKLHTDVISASESEYGIRSQARTAHSG